MTDTKIQKFKFAIPIIKTRVRIVKDKDGNEVEERYVEGVASGTELDKHGDRMAPSAIESMAKSLKQHVINLNDEHDTSWSGELGDITKLIISKNNDLELAAKLNEMSSAKDLWYALTEQNKKLGLSIGGFVKDYEMVKEGKGDDAKWVRVYKEIELDHIAVTSRPAYPKAWVSVISKSIDSKTDSELILKKEVELKEEKSRRSQHNKRLRELARKLVKRVQAMEADLLLELTYTGLQFCDESLLLLIERSFSMAEKDVSLEAEEAKKKAEAKKSKSEDKKDETLAAPEDEESKEEESEEEAEEEETEEESKEKSKEETEEKASEEESEESESEESDEGEEDKEKGEKEGEESDDEEESESEEEDEEESSEEKSEKEPANADAEKLLQVAQGLTEGMKKVLKSNEELTNRVKELEGQPASRKTIEVKKGLGDEEGDDKTAEELIKERDKKIKEARKEHANDPNLFARVQRIRSDYSQKVKTE